VALALRASVLIHAPPARVFDLVCTPERLPEWNVSIENACRRVPGEPVCLGSRAIFSGRLLGQPLESETEVVTYEPPRLFATRAVRGPRLTTRFELEPSGDATRVHVNLSGEVPGGAIGGFLAEGFLRKELAASLERLRVIGESSSN
jgi:uncharacterized protein YndB with AHSA1/START domain